MGECSPQQGHMALQAVQQLLQLLKGGGPAQLAPPAICYPEQQLQPGVDYVHWGYRVGLKLGPSLQHTYKQTSQHGAV